jgi:Ribonuclease G/E
VPRRWTLLHPDSLAALALWVGWLYLVPFGRCPKCKGTGHSKSGRRRMKVCPRCKGRRRVQRRGSRTIHRLARKLRDGQRAATRYQEDNDGTP